jgi:RNA polymerase sigma-70 factor (ECF subfamily)
MYTTATFAPTDASSTAFRTAFATPVAGAARGALAGDSRRPPPLAQGAATKPDWTALVAQRNSLVRFARRRLLDPSLAEDVVHDVFEAVASGRARFDGRASLRTWLTAILKHKIVDLVRSRRGHESLDQPWGDDDEADLPAELECPQPRPDEVAALRERLHRTLARIEALPDTLRHAFERRVLADEESSDVCRALGISENNLFVRLHRARALLAA